MSAMPGYSLGGLRAAVLVTPPSAATTVGCEEGRAGTPVMDTLVLGLGAPPGARVPKGESVGPRCMARGAVWTRAMVEWTDGGWVSE